MPLPKIDGIIDQKVQNNINELAKLKRIARMINNETWLELDVDVKGAIYEGLLQKMLPRARVVWDSIHAKSTNRYDSCCNEILASMRAF